MESPPIRPFGHSQHHHGSSLSSNSVLIIAVSAISIGLVLVVFLAILLLRRLRGASSSDSKSSFNKETNNNIGGQQQQQQHITILPPNGLCNNTSRSVFIPPHSTPLHHHFASSPDVRGGGCLSSGGLVQKTTQGRAIVVKRAAVQVFTYRELELATEKFSEGNVIGNGGYGVVYKGILSDGRVAAIKMLHREGKQAERAFRIEAIPRSMHHFNKSTEDKVDLLSRLHSSYLVELVGYCADQQHRLLIFEFLPNGTLQQHLHHSKQYQPLDWATRLRIALDCARALEFLHEHAVPAVIHRDFKCSNILLDQNFRAKVSDFGLAKTGSDKINGLVSTRVLGTTGYLAPEYASTGKLTTKSDVYSYGVVLLQLLTGRIPVDIKRPPGEHVLVSWALPRLTSREKVGEMVDPALEGQYSKKDLVQVAAIAAMCVQPEADYRPLMTDVVQSLIPLVKNLSSSSSSSSVSSSARFQNQISPREASMMCKRNDMSHRALLLC
ncbi:Probable serine/threonine-protein kinase PBL7 [Linum grandiflorum]